MSSRLGIILAGLLVSATFARAQMPPAAPCHTDTFRGMTQPGGTTALMHVTSDAPACTVRVWTTLDPPTPYDRLDIAAAPRFGTATVFGSTFAYRPQPGFTGRDEFTVTGTGKTARGTPVTGTVRVSVDVAPKRS